MLIISTIKDIPDTKYGAYLRSVFMLPGVICAGILGSSGVNIQLNSDTTASIIKDLNNTDTWSQNITNTSNGSNEPVIGNIIFDTDNGNEENKIVQTKEVNNKSSNRLTIDDLYDLNPHQIPYEMILDFLENRKAKRSPLTRTAWLKINKELLKSGNALNAFEEMVSRGWVSLNVDWLKSNNKRTEIDDNNTDWA